MIRWKGNDPWGFILGGASVLLLGAAGMQYLAVKITCAIAAVAPEALSPFDYLGLWGTGQPGVRDGAVGFDLLHWIILGLLLTVAVAATWVTVVLLRRRGKNPEHLLGLASISDVVKHAGRRQLLKRASALRPSLPSPKADDVGFLIATFRGTEVWVSVEDPMILVGPSRSGKGFYFIVKMIVRAAGAVVTTSCKVDNVKLTMEARATEGRPVHVFAPGVDAAKGLGRELRWDPIVGCEDEEILKRRMSGLVPKDSFGGGTTNGGHWDTLGRQIATALFHAAALGGKTVDEVWGWVVNVSHANEALEIIRGDARGISEHADRLAMVLQAPAEKRATEWATVATVLSYLDSRSVRAWLKPAPGKQFDIPRFLLNRGTLFMVGNEDGSGGYQQVVGALMEEIDHVADGLAAAMPGSRIDPPVSFILDEAANFHIQMLPKLISAGGGAGKQVLAVFQSRSQMSAWGQAVERAMWDAASIKIVLPGGSDEQDLRGLSNLIGESPEARESFSSSASGASTSWSEQETAILTASAIRTMPKGTALVFHREMKPIVGRLTSWLEMKEAAGMKAAEKALSATLRDQSAYSALVAEHQWKTR
jgi:type IV secretion system protein VirD4